MDFLLWLALELLIPAISVVARTLARPIERFLSNFDDERVG